MDEVARTGRPIVITKHGKPVAQLAPVAAEPGSLFGYMRNSVQIKGDVVAATGEKWNAMSGAPDRLLNAGSKKLSAPRTKK
jgi:antitoxin (DNA-binding transcriptional repressor) of toxin-antitoxin stability system